MYSKNSVGTMLNTAVLCLMATTAALAQSAPTPAPAASASTTVTPTAAPTAAATTASGAAGAGCITDYDPSAGVDYFPDKAEVQYAETFSVEYFDTYKVLDIFGTVYVLYQCGTPEPTLDDVTVQQYISIPVSKVATGTPDHIPRIELLGQRDSIVAYTGAASLIGSPCVDALVADGTVVEATVFNETCASDVTDNAALMELDVEVAFGDSLSITGYCSGSPEAIMPLTHNGVAIQSYLETGPTAALAQGESIKLFSLFYNEEAQANIHFEEIESLWLCTKNNAQGCSLQLDNTPAVAWFSYVPTDPSSSFYEAGSGWGYPKNDTYYAYAIENTGGVMLECGDDTSGLMTDEEMLACFGDADVCVFAADYDEVVEAFEMDALNQLACVQNERVYDITLSGINSWFEATSVEPHVLMEDMVVVLHGDEFDYGLGSYERLLLRDALVEESESGSYYLDEGTCADTEAALEIQGQCDIIVDFNTCEDPPDTDEQDSPASKVAAGGAWAAVAASVAGLLAVGIW